MADIIWTPPTGWVEETGAHVSFAAPCNCADAENLVIGTHTYTIVDAISQTITGTDGVFISGALLDFILDCANYKAYYQGYVKSNVQVESLWSGSWTSGSITVPNIENYSVLIVNLAGVMCIACKSDVHLWGSNIYPYNNYQYIRHLDASLSGETLTMIACGELRHSPGTGHTSAFTSKSVTQIWGVI